jgi:hypothetical protein
MVNRGSKNEMDIVPVHYIVNGKRLVIPTKVFIESSNEDDFDNIRLEVIVNNRHIQSTHTNFEYAVKYLQKALPDNIHMACCQSCQHGNFNPFGDLENQIFCLKDIITRNREVVVEIFSKQDETFETRSRRKLLDFCTDYKPISNSEKYTYNDWGPE